MLSFTLDTNCIVAVDENRPEAGSVRCLANAQMAGAADVAVVAIMASEKQKQGVTIETFDQFIERLRHLGLGHLGLCLPPLYFDISFFDYAVWASPEGMELDRHLHRILFPDIEFEFQDFCRARGLDTHSEGWNGIKQQWRNAKCDVLALWSHIINGRDVFVTSDGNFYKASKYPALIAAGAGRIERPEAAAALLSTS